MVSVKAADAAGGNRGLRHLNCVETGTHGVLKESVEMLGWMETSQMKSRPLLRYRNQAHQATWTLVSRPVTTRVDVPHRSLATRSRCSRSDFD